MINLIRRRTPSPAPAPLDPLAEAEAIEAAALAARADAERQAAIGDAELAAAERKARLDEIAHRAEIARRKRERAAALAEARDAEAARAAEVSARRGSRRQTFAHWRQTLAANSARLRRLVINLGVNSAAGYGQALYLIEQAGLPTGWAAALAGLLELIAVTVLDYGLTARKAGRPYALAFAVSALMAGTVAYLNYSHWSVTEGRQGLAIPFAIMSLISPVLWAWYHAARDAEQALTAALSAPSGMPAAPSGTPTAPAGNELARFPLARWVLWFPETFAAKRQAVRLNLTDPDRAVELAVEHRAARQAERAERQRQRELDRASKRRPELPPPTDDDETETEGDVELPLVPQADELAEMTDDQIQEAARQTYKRARLDGLDPSGRDLGQAYGRSDSWGRARIREVKPFIVVGPDDAAGQAAG
ncbi:hypothetical protein JOL79_06730 [Microbispora sp. RL4-1S]|uniref:DUF2637 domain-containing protein n=1 Tax=Microbispora oryzae TaxID=2806554 RepID=A0A940WHV5_9ACTN|nr:hypothetical protein [Microbispora oryzae]MBP2703492.1 hypothetical protein [Microbispora oryzae]